MAEFDSAVQLVLRNEGGLTKNVDSKDLGGITNKGISYRFLKSLSPEQLRSYGMHDIPNEEDLKNLTDDQAKAIYRGEFWSHAPFAKLHNQKIANYIFDCAVSMGISPAIKCAQRACWAIDQDMNLKEDGILGPHTIDAINSYSFYFLPPLRAERAAYYRMLVERNSSLKEFLNGWLSRAYL